MTWQEIRKQLPNRWLLVEASKAHTENGKRVVDDYAVLGVYDSDVSDPAMEAYLEAHRENRSRELYVMHSSEADPIILERPWNGVRVRL